MDWIKDFLRPEYIWVLIGLFFLLLEIFLPGLIVFFFGLGALLVAAMCFFIDVSVNLQLVVFVISSILMLIILRKWLQGIFVGHVYSEQAGSEDLSDFVGKKVIVQEKIVPPQSGTVEFNGVSWKAQADVPVEVGQMVQITGRDSLTLIVKPLDS